jgi:hypothetical protein
VAKKLAECFLVQKVYSRTPQDLEIILPAFLDIVGEMPEEALLYGFKEHMKESSDFPTPHEILKHAKRWRHPSHVVGTREWCEETGRDYADYKKKLDAARGIA